MKKIFSLTVMPILFIATSFAQNVGIGTNTPTAQFHTTGSVRHAALSGVGVRPVFADASGNLLVTAPPLPPTSSTNATTQNIPDISCTGVTSTNSLSGLPTGVQSASIAVTVNITHPRLADLSIYLTAPDGSIINLVSPVATVAGANFTNTIFTDGGAQLSAGAAPYNGQFKPYADATPTLCGITQTVTSFGTIGGGTINPNGTWTLKVIDNTAANTGILKSWTVSVVSGLGIDGVWGVKGNSGTNEFNFLGTTDNRPLQFKVNNIRAGYVDQSNVFWGYQSGLNNTIGISNTAGGTQALFLNNIGALNTAIGYQALRSNTGGNFNTANGGLALDSNTTGSENTANGYQTLLDNTTGSSNTATGSSALQSNTTGLANTANGVEALFKSTMGNWNTATGFYALGENTTGNNNTAYSSYSLSSNTTGSNNTALGYQADVTLGDLTNATAVGYGALVDASNKVRIGNAAVTVIEGQVAYSFPSDARFKYDIKNNVPGLDFITRLTPVTYYFDEQKLNEYTRTGLIGNNIAKSASYAAKQLHTGFLAQDVEKIANQLGYSFDGIHAPANSKDHYSLAYTQFIMPLVKAVQEQQQIIEAEKNDIDTLKAQVTELTKAINTLMHK